MAANLLIGKMDLLPVEPQRRMQTVTDMDILLVENFP
jgi:hypothetical protein